MYPSEAKREHIQLDKSLRVRHVTQPGHQLKPPPLNSLHH